MSANRSVVVSILALASLSAAPAQACSHGHIGAGGFALNIWPFLAIDVRAHHHVPCPEAMPAPIVVAQAAPVYVTPPPQYVSSPPPAPVYITPPPMVAAPAPQYVPVPVPTPAPAAPTVVTQFERRDPERPALLGLKYAPGANASIAWTDVVSAGSPSFAQSVGLEFRATSWLALRSDLEFRAAGRSWDALGLKLSTPTMVSPYISGSFSVSERLIEPGKYQVGAMAAVGLDVKLGRHFFIEGEVRYRVAPGDCCREQPQLTGLVGAGVAFF